MLPLWSASVTTRSTKGKACKKRDELIELIVGVSNILMVHFIGGRIVAGLHKGRDTKGKQQKGLRARLGLRVTAGDILETMCSIQGVWPVGYSNYGMAEVVILRKHGNECGK